MAIYVIVTAAAVSKISTMHFIAFWLLSLLLSIQIQPSMMQSKQRKRKRNGEDFFQQKINELDENTVIGDSLISHTSL